MKKYKIAVLDDYQNTAIESTDWSVLGQGRAVSGIPRLKFVTGIELFVDGAERRSERLPG
jgi:hypothetical protein